MKQDFTSKILRALIIASTLIVAGCGSDDDDDSTVIFVPENQQREEGPVATGPDIIINNRIDNDVKVINKNIRVENNDLIIRYLVINLDPVVHQQYIYASVNCSAAANNDINGDGVVDQVEFEEAVGQPVAILNEAQGTTLQTQQQFPVTELPPEEENFAFVVYGAEEGVTVPVICNSFNVNKLSSSDTTNNEPQTPAEPTTEEDASPEEEATEE